MNTLLYAAALLGGAAINVATGMNTAPGKAFAEHRLLAALAIQGVGVLALFLVALVGGGLAARPSSEALAGVAWWALGGRRRAGGHRPSPCWRRPARPPRRCSAR